MDWGKGRGDGTDRWWRRSGGSARRWGGRRVRRRPLWVVGGERDEGMVLKMDRLRIDMGGMDACARGKRSLGTRLF